MDRRAFQPSASRCGTQYTTISIFVERLYVLFAERLLQRLFSVLMRIQIVVVPFLCKQLVVRSALLNLALSNYENAIRTANGRKTMRNDKARSALQYILNGILDQLFRFRINGACRFVENENTRICKHNACKRDQLFLPDGKSCAALSDFGIIAVLLLFYKHIRMDKPRSFANLLLRSIRSTEGNIVTNRSRKEMRRLEHIAAMRLQQS